jgi:hypothetical protein
METELLYRALEFNELIWIWDGVFRLATGYGLAGPEFESRQGKKFSFVF